MHPDMLELMEVYYGEKAAKEYERMQGEVASLKAELAEKQAYILQLERSLDYLRRINTSSSPTAGA